MRKFFSHGEKWEKKFSQWDSHWEMRKKGKNICRSFSYKYIAQEVQEEVGLEQICLQIDQIKEG